MLNRRRFVLSAVTALSSARAAQMQPKERVNAVLHGRTPDRAPFTFYHHFKDEKQPGLKHAATTLDYQRRYQLDFVKVMSDYPYPKSAGAQWYELREVASPFPEQLKALELIRDGLASQKFFLETQFNPWNVAEKLSSKEAVAALMHEKPQALLDALEAIAKSEIHHIKAALDLDVAGILISIANAQQGILTIDEYRKFSEPFDRMVLQAAQDAPLTTLHLHGEKVYLDHFWKGWTTPVIQYSCAGTKVSLAEARQKCAAVLMGGLDENSVVKAPQADIEAQMKLAHAAAPKWICAPGCSIPDDSTEAGQLKLSHLLRSA